MTGRARAIERPPRAVGRARTTGRRGSAACAASSCRSPSRPRSPSGRWMGQGQAAAAGEPRSGDAPSLRQSGRQRHRGHRQRAATTTRSCSLPGSRVGAGGVACDLAVDALQATDSLARGQGGAMAVLAVAGPGAMMSAPDIYMQKIVVGPRSAGVIDIDLPVTVNLQRIAAVARPHHERDHRHHARPTAPRGPRGRDPGRRRPYQAHPRRRHHGEHRRRRRGTGDHAYIGIGGTAEGIITAAAMRCLGGEIQAQVLAAVAPRGRDRPRARHRRHRDAG